MPELPEVETVVRGLRKTVLHKTIQKVITNAPPSSIVVGESFHKKSFTQILKNKKILEINRRGKNILITLSGEITLWVHLKMTGKFTINKKDTPLEKHDLVEFQLISNDKKKGASLLRFNDYRRFGRLRLFYTNELWEQKGLKELGPEPLELAVDDFVQMCTSTKRMIKPALLDQSFIAGIGNIYADESLFASRIHPSRITSSVSKKKLIDLHGHIQRILAFAIDNMGSSVDSYRGVNGETGNFQTYLKVYGNENGLCERCGKKIKRIKLGSRSAHFCPNCQRL